MSADNDFDCGYENQWCPGCGNFGILQAMKEALTGLGLQPRDLLIVSGIGQAAKTPHFIKCNFFHALHGRALPVATGAKIANHTLNIVVNTGDGDCYGEGGNHFIHAIRRNIDLTVLAHNNGIYGLTKGQASPTTAQGIVTPLQQSGVVSRALNPVALALAAGVGFVARGYSGKPTHLSRLIQEAMNHRGFSLIDILQPCVSFNRLNTHQWYKQRVYELDGADHDPGDFRRAQDLAAMWGDKIPLGILFQVQNPEFTAQLPVLAEGPLVSRTYRPQRLQKVLQSA